MDISLSGTAEYDECSGGWEPLTLLVSMLSHTGADCVKECAFAWWACLVIMCADCVKGCWQVCSMEEGLAAREDLIKTWEEDDWSAEKIRSNLEVHISTATH